MRDALALALIRAEHCRIYAEERHRLDVTTSKNSARALIGRAVRSIRGVSRGLSARDAKSRRAERAGASAASPPD